MSLRADAIACFHQAVAVVEPAALVECYLAGRPVVVPNGGRLALVAIGKAARAMTRGALQALPGPVDRGVVIVPAGPDEAPANGLPAAIEIHRGGHPVPSHAGVRGAEAILDLARGLGENDVLLCLISGGGSALMTLPAPGLSLAGVRDTTDRLLKAGASIGELNCVRKHLDRLKGGRLASAAAPSRLVALVLSDVVGDPLDVIASGPVVADPTTFADALGVLERRGVLTQVPEAVRRHFEKGIGGEAMESPKPGDGCFARVEAGIVGHNGLAAEAALAEARRRGYEAMLLSTVLTGEARQVGRVLASLGQEVRRRGRPLRPPACLVAAGETTVTVRGSGRGGRNQEVALGAALALEALPGSDGILVAALGTDGVDGPTDAAGAMASAETVMRARQLGLDALRALEENDSYPFFEAVGGLVKTGPTGTNVMDLVLILIS